MPESLLVAINILAQVSRKTLQIIVDIKQYNNTSREKRVSEKMLIRVSIFPIHYISIIVVAKTTSGYSTRTQLSEEYNFNWERSLSEIYTLLSHLNSRHEQEGADALYPMKSEDVCLNKLVNSMPDARKELSFHRRRYSLAAHRHFQVSYEANRGISLVSNPLSLKPDK